jgi:small-conductance mechanosensitive channel
VKSALGLDEPQVAQTVARAIQVLVTVLITLWLANWAGSRIRRAARASGAYTDVASLISRTVALAIIGVGIAVALSIVGVSPTAIAAILGAFTLGISLSLQDVGRSFVTGLYLLIERPFRIGDWIRIGESAGRVEEIGIRLVRLRGDGGDRIMVPSTLVFSSVVENSSLGSLDRQTYSVEGIERPIAEIEPAVAQALAGLPHLSPRQPVVSIVQTSPQGTRIDVTVEHDRGQRLESRIMSQLRAEFPEATVGTKIAASDS